MLDPDLSRTVVVKGDLEDTRPAPQWFHKLVEMNADSDDDEANDGGLGILIV